MSGSDIPLFTATPAAIGTMDATVPIEVPVAVPIKADIINMPTVRNCTGIRLIPRLTTESRPPIAAATAENAPARI